MVLSHDASGSQRFSSDGGLRTGDIRALTSPPALTLEGPIAAADYAVTPIKGTPYLYVTVTLHDGRGPVRQEGDFRLAHASRSSGTLQVDEPDVMRLPFVTKNVNSPDPTGSLDALLYTQYGTTDVLGVIDLSGATPWLGHATSVTDPTVVAVAGYPVAGATPLRMLCNRVARFAGTEYFMAGFFSQNGATSTLQAITNITTNPPTVAYVPTGGDPISDLVQLPDGSLMVWNNGRITMVNTTVAPAAVVWADHRAAMPPAGYFVGVQALGGGRPLVYAMVGNQYGVGGTTRLKLVSISLDGWVVSDVTTGLPWVTFATAVRDGLMCCDGTNHVYLNGRRNIPMNWLKDRPVNTDYTVICRGHYTDGQRFWWKANQISPGQQTAAWWEECHFDLLDEEGAPISTPVSMSSSIGVDAQTVGGWNLPYFPTTRTLTEYSNGSWFSHKVAPNGQMGYNRRKQAGTSAGSGDEFASSGFDLYYSWPKLTIPGLENCPMVLVRMTAPPNRHIRTGQDAAGGYTSGAYVQMDELLSGMSARFHAQGPDERRPVREFTLNRSWSYGFQPKVTLGQQAGGTDDTHYTPNGLPLTYEFIAVKPDAVGHINPSILRGLDASRVLRLVA